MQASNLYTNSISKQALPNDEPIDINQLIESVKKERQQQLIEEKQKEEHNNNLNPQCKSATDILPWEQIKNENDALLRKNRNRIATLTKKLNEAQLDVNKIRKQCWRGIPSSMRSIIWKILLGYIPSNRARREIILNKKRMEYEDLIDRYYNKTNDEHRSFQESKSFTQIKKDIRRMNKLFQIDKIHKILLRTLYIWSLKHAATGYVQGIHDLLTPFIYIFLNEYVNNNFNNIILNDNKNIKIINKIINQNCNNKILLQIEADSYWCLDLLIEGLQINYVDKQPGITIMMKQLEDIIKRIDNKLYKYLISKGIKFFQFSYRWMNCLLMRELTLKNIIRLWDTYLCEGVKLSSGFTEFHVFVCASLLLTFKNKIMMKEFDEILLFLQDLQNVTKDWNEREIETILSQAFVYQQLFGQNNRKSLF